MSTVAIAKIELVWPKGEGGYIPVSEMRLTLTSGTEITLKGDIPIGVGAGLYQSVLEDPAKQVHGDIKRLTIEGFRVGQSREESKLLLRARRILPPLRAHQAVKEIILAHPRR